jgi:ribosome-associated toxin RatA of RatAB toxin-antitoxin module
LWLKLSVGYVGVALASVLLRGVSAAPLPAVLAPARSLRHCSSEICMTTRILRSALLPYPAAVLYGLVNDVARYPEFLPWCSATEVLEVSEVQMLARLVIAKGGLSQRFVTRNQLQPGQRIEMNLEEGPFTQLNGVWEFKALGEQACKISLDLSFDYAGPLVKATLGPLFNQAANTLVDAFCQRVKQLHG